MEIIAMKANIPDWAKQTVTSDEDSFFKARRAHRQGYCQIQLPDLSQLKDWAKAHKWPAPWFGFKEAFLKMLFENHQNFSLALRDSGVTMQMPISEHTLTAKMLQELDEMYDAREDAGALGMRPTQWGSLVEELREIRHLVEAGITVKVEGQETALNSWQGFYTWAHGRYHMLEDGYDSWIGDDKS